MTKRECWGEAHTAREANTVGKANTGEKLNTGEKAITGAKVNNGEKVSVGERSYWRKTEYMGGLSIGELGIRGIPKVDYLCRDLNRWVSTDQGDLRKDTCGYWEKGGIAKKEVFGRTRYWEAGSTGAHELLGSHGGYWGRR